MKRLLILSGKGGTGKTTVSAALVALSQAKAVADCDVDAPNLHLVMHPTQTPQTTPFFGGDKAQVDSTLCMGCGTCQRHCRFHGIRVYQGKAVVNRVSCEGCGVCQWVCPAKAVTLVPDVTGTRLLYQGQPIFSTATLKMGRGNSGKLVTDVKLAMLKHAPDCHLAILDGSPGIGCPVMASISGMDLVLVVAEPSQSGLSDLQRLVQTVETFQTPLVVCINKYDTSPESTNRIQAFCQAQSIAVVGLIPFDPEAVHAVNAGRTIVDTDCPAGQAVQALYQTIIHYI